MLILKVHQLPFLLFACTCTSSQNWSQNLVPTGPQHSPVARPSHSVLLLRSLQCRNELLKSFLCSCDLLLCLYFLCQNIVCCFVVIGVFNFSALSCVACFTMPCALQVLLSPEGFLLQWLKLLCKILLFTLIWFISWLTTYSQLLQSILSRGGRVLIVSLIFCAFSYTVCNLCSNVCSSAFSNN
jgi:hypothetical protein